MITRLVILLVALSFPNLSPAQTAGLTRDQEKKIEQQVKAGMRQIAQAEAKLRTPEYYGPAAHRLALYCQSDPKLFPKMLTPPWLPEPVADLLYGRGSVGPDGANIEFGGGFYHFEYSLRRDEKRSKPGKNVWQLYLDREDKESIPLTTVTLKPGEQLTVDELQHEVDAGFDRRILSGHAEEYCNKVAFQLRTDRLAVAEDTCRQWIQAKPESWKARLALAHLQCRGGDGETATADLVAWVKAHPNFAYGSYVALFALREEKSPVALDAVRMALQQPFIEPPDTEGNRYYLAMNDALIAFGNGEYDLCLAMCARMLAATPQDAYWQRGALGIKAAALAMKGDKAAAQAAREDSQKIVSDRQIGLVSPVAGSELAAAIERDDLPYVRNARNWVDVLAQWFDPFQQTGESQLFYPSSWKGDLIKPKAAD